MFLSHNFTTWPEFVYMIHNDNNLNYNIIEKFHGRYESYILGEL